MNLAFRTALMSGTRIVTAFTPLSLFASGEVGAWYDPSDMSTMFQDAAGTTPVTAVEQPVGRILDKSGRGNHATQSTSASRPVLSARVNLLTKSEQFDDAAWSKQNGATISTNVITSPIGNTTAEKLIEGTIASSTYQVAQAFSPNLTSGVQYTFSFYAKAAERSWVWFGSNGAVGLSGVCYFDIGNGVVGTIGSPFTNGTVENAGNGWYRCTVKGTPTANASANFFIGIALGNNNRTYTGDGTSGIYVWGADLRPTNDGVGLPVYQRVNTSTDYDTTGFPLYLRFDGTDDGLVTGSLDFTSTNKMTVWAGLRQLSSTAAFGTVAELSSDYNPNLGAFTLFVPTSAAGGDTIRWAAGGTSDADINFDTNISAPVPHVLTGISDIPNDITILRRNGLQVASLATDLGTGNFGNYPLYVGRRNNTTLPLNGRLYSLIVRGAQSSDAQITSTENWVNGKTRAY